MWHLDAMGNLFVVLIVLLVFIVYCCRKLHVFEALWDYFRKIREESVDFISWNSFKTILFWAFAFGACITDISLFFKTYAKTYPEVEAQMQSYIFFKDTVFVFLAGAGLGALAALTIITVFRLIRRKDDS